MTIWTLVVGIGVCLLVLSFTIGPAFYPPGEGYAEERFYGRISLALMVAGLAMICAPLLWSIATAG